MADKGWQSLKEATTQSAKESNGFWRAKVDELNHQLDRKATLAKEGQEKLRTIKASVIEAIELNREKLKRLLKQLKEHEKDVIAMRDVKLKEAAVNEYNRATTSIEEKLVQVGTLSYYHSFQSLSLTLNLTLTLTLTQSLL